MGARYSAPVQTGPGAYPASYKMGAWSFPGVKRPGCGVEHPPPLAPSLKKSRERDHLEDLSVDGMLILKWVFN